MDPLQHYLQAGAAEGRSYNIGSSPYHWTGANVGGGLGATPQGFGDAYPAGTGSPVNLGLGGAGGFGGGLNVSGGVGNGAFGLGGIVPMGGGFSGGLLNPYGFSGLNPSAYFGNGTPSLSSYYPVGGLGGGAGAGAGAGGGADVSNPWGFSGLDVSGFNANAGGGGEGGGASGEGSLEGGSGFDSAEAERAYLAYQEMTNNLQRNAGLDPRAIDFNLHNVALGNGGNLPANFSPTAQGSNVNQSNINLAALTPQVPNLTVTNLTRSYGPTMAGGLGGIAPYSPFGAGAFA